ncbi:MAG: nicotinate (nicotinamide) nucleotide adenylyltransferase [Microscillaceae bacterium]
MKTGLFFGSFNPIHIGHLIIANTMAENTDLREVWLVVSPQNPFKPQKGLLHEFDRFDMVERAISDNYRLRVTDVEFHLPRPSYTVHTLTVLQEKYPEREFALIMGSDNLLTFPKWKNYSHILEHFSLYVYPRPGQNQSPLMEHPKVRMVPAPLLDISATFIRQAIQNQQSIRYLVPEAVETMIRVRKFYQ